MIFSENLIANLSSFLWQFCLNQFDANLHSKIFSHQSQGPVEVVKWHVTNKFYSYWSRMQIQLLQNQSFLYKWSCSLQPKMSHSNSDFFQDGASQFFKSLGIDSSEGSTRCWSILAEIMPLVCRASILFNDPQNSTRKESQVVSCPMAEL